MRIDIDQDGYPTEESILDLGEWGRMIPVDAAGILAAVAEYLVDCSYGSAKRRARSRGIYWRFTTGGWSGCEIVISAIPPIVQAIAWRSSHRGGLHIYMVPK